MKRIILALALIVLVTPCVILFAQQKGAGFSEAEALISKARADGKVTFYANITATKEAFILSTVHLGCLSHQKLI